MQHEKQHKKNLDAQKPGPYDDDVTVEPTDETEGESASLEKLKTLREKLKACEVERKEYLAGWQRAKADFVNFKKETEAAGKEYVSFANESFIRELLPIIDSFAEAFRNKEAWEKVDKGWRTGVEYIHGQLAEVLARHGFQAFGEAGEEFSPERHLPMETVETMDAEKDGTVAEVLQQGILVKDKVLRPARVKIFQMKKEK